MKTGALVEAKGPRKKFRYSQDWARAMADDLKQAAIQSRTADERGVGLKWYYAEKGAADTAREIFKRNGLEKIVVKHMPPKSR